MGDNGTYGYLVQSDGTVLAKTTFDERGHEDKAVWTLWLRRDNRWIQAVSTVDALEFPDLWGVTPDGQTLIIDTWDNAEKMWRPTRVSRADGKLGEFIGPPREQSPLLDSNGVVLGFSHQDRFVEYDFVEPRLKALWPAYRAAFKDQQVSLVSWTPDLRKLILYVAGPGNPGGYYIADTTTKRVDPIGAAYPKVTASDVGTVRFVDYKAADGLDIQGVLTLPRGKPEKNLPLIVFPHGGPRAHDDLSFDWWAQALASRGYAVLQPNFRGSTGYGRAFLEAGYGEWGAKMQTDLSDGVADLARQGVIDPKRVCIVGASYGGYAALAGVSLQKGVYRCAVSVAGLSDLPGRLHDETLRYGERSTAIRDRKRLYGVDSENDPKLRARSPAAHADAVQVPVLLIHGKDDTVVPFSESQKMASALRSAGKPYEIVALDGEDHNLSKSVTRQQMLTATVAFLEKNNPPN
jgi:dipeptidyl aminopeptidase/acylaminoacyl peptidase